MGEVAQAVGVPDTAAREDAVPLPLEELGDRGAAEEIGVLDVDDRAPLAQETRGQCPDVVVEAENEAAWPEQAQGLPEDRSGIRQVVEDLEEADRVEALVLEEPGVA